MAAATRETLLNEDEIFLIVSPLDAKDFNSGRCRLAVSSIKQAGLAINSPISLAVGKLKVFCRVWPAPNYPPKDFVQIDQSVVLPMESECQDVERVTGCRVNLLNDIKLVKPREAKVVNVSVYVRSEDKMCPRLLYDKERRKAQVKCIMQDKVFTSHCWVHVKKLLRCGLAFVEEIDKIFINDVEFTTENDSTEELPSENDVAMISSDTDVVIKCIKISRPNSKLKKPICLAAYGDVFNFIHDSITLPATFFKSCDKLYLDHAKGFLLLGPPGVGKTLLAVYLADQWGAELFVLNGADIFGPHMGESEDNLRNIFARAREASKYIPCVLFIDEIDALCPKRSQGSGVENRVASQLLTLIDEITTQTNVILIAATNRPNALDPALRRPGRFDKEFVIGVPSSPERLEILKCLTEGLSLSSDVKLDVMAKQCLGYVAADLAALVRQSAMNALNATLSTQGSDKNITITMNNFKKAFNEIVPSTYRGMDGIVESSPVKWEDIGGYEDVKKALKQAVEWPFLYPDAFSRLGLSRPRGILLYGPPGCSKTTLVRAAATTCHCTFLSLSCAQLYSPYVGDAERLIQEVFTKARAACPAILFLDEVDAVVRKRSIDGSTGVEARILSTLLNELDGVGISNNVYETRCTSRKLADEKPRDKNILFVAATNRPEILDEAILRPGRIDRVIYVPHPDRNARLEILKVYCKKIPLEDDVDLDVIADKTEIFSGADLKNLCREAALNALQEVGVEECSRVDQKHFVQALSGLAPSLSQQQVDAYKNLVIS